MDNKSTYIPGHSFLRRGIGTTLSTLILDEARKIGYERVFYWPDEDEIGGIKIAENLGFKVIEHRLMYKDLSSALAPIETIVLS